jgi:hypothetical protein
MSDLWRNKDDESKQFICQDCGSKNYKLFMANDKLWQNKGTGDNTLCKKCFEKKLGRKMTEKDIEQYKYSPINFKEWFFLVETTTIAQTIQKILNNENPESLEIQILQKFKETVNEYINGLQEFEVIPENKKIIYKNYFTYQLSVRFIKETYGNLSRIDLWYVRRFLDDVKDYLIAKKDDNALKSRLNNVDFTFDRLQAESNQWHQELAERTRGIGREAETFIDLSHLGSQWQGWRWVHINRKYCELEAASGGHCGNVAGKLDDTILSLRDPENKVHLTFIENKGILGEMKGRNNNKPSPKYHAPIIELLKNNKILTIKGGGYLPKNNFSLDDLANKEELLTIKPNLDISNFIPDLPDQEKIEYINDMLAANLSLDEHGNFVLHHYENTKDFLEALKQYTNSNIDRKINLGFIDDLFAGDINIDLTINDYDIKEAIRSLNKASFERLKEKAKKEGIELEKPEAILSIEDENLKEEILDNIKMALHAALESNLLSQYWKDFKSSFETNEDRDLLIIKIESVDDIKICLNKKFIETILKQNKNIDDLISDLNFNYYPLDIYPEFDPVEFNDTVVDYI